MIIGRHTLSTLGALAAAASLALGALPAHAESACKGLEKPACEKKANCYWVDPYSRKDGVKVSGHCRTKATKNDSGSTSKSSKDAKKSSKDSKK